MKATFVSVLALAAILVLRAPDALADPVGTAFTYQGWLMESGSPVTGEGDFVFRLFSSETTPPGVQIGPTLTFDGQGTNPAPIDIADGQFTVKLDFGVDPWILGDSEARWLEIRVRVPHDPTNTLPYTTLTPRQELTPTPFSLATRGVNTDASSLELQVGGSRALRLKWESISPNLIGGQRDNAVTAGVYGAAIGGGGSANWPNFVFDHHSTVAGGLDNSAGTDDGTLDNATFASVGGGRSNVAGGQFATVAGGRRNSAGPGAGTIAGGVSNMAASYGAVGGGLNNAASEYAATVPGGDANRAAGRNSFAAGVKAHALHNGAFVWSSRSTVFESTAPNQFLIDAPRVGIGTNAPAAQLHIGGAPGVDGIMFPDSTLQTTAYTGGAGGGNTLDAAYDQGGAGAGRTITADTGPVDIDGPSGLNVNGHVGIGIAQSSWAKLIAYSDSAPGSGGLWGWASAVSGDATGVTGWSQSDSGRGVYGWARAASGRTYGVYGKSDSPDGYGGYFEGRGYFSGDVWIGGTDPSASARMHVYSSAGARVRVGGNSDGDFADLQLFENTALGGETGIALEYDGVENELAFSSWVGGSRTATIMAIERDGNVGIGTDTPGAKLDVNGTARVRVLQIIGADLAEKFPVSEEVKPGSVVAIDPDHPGQLCLARGAYNRRVAGVVSGANGLSVGAVLGNLPGSEGAPPIALSGRVWVHCDASNGSIQPGDLLTTSGTAGHAMKVTDYPKAQGAIIGKAMTSLNSDTGLVLVLVSLQ